MSRDLDGGLERPADGSGARSVTLKAILIGLAGVIFINWAGPYSSVRLASSYMSNNQMPLAVVFSFTMIVLVFNGLTKSLASWLERREDGEGGAASGLLRRITLSSGELIIVFVMLLASAMVSTMYFSGYVVPTIASPAAYAQDNYAYAQKTMPFLNKYFFPFDPDSWLHGAEAGTAPDPARWPNSTPISQSMTDFWRGVPPASDTIPGMIRRVGVGGWLLWGRALFFWVLFFFSLYFALFCVMTVLRKQWVEYERLNFPLAQLPMAMVRGADDKHRVGELFRSRLMWMGFAVPLVLKTWNGLARFYPYVKEISTRQELFYFENNVVHVHYELHFPMLGFAWFMKLETAGSLVFFVFVTFIQNYLWYSLWPLDIGHVQGTPWKLHPALALQAYGAMLVFTVAIFWAARYHLAAVGRRVLGIAPPPGRRVYSGDDSNEALSYRTAVVGFGVSFVIMVLWLVASGLTPWVAVAVLVLAMMGFVAVTKFIAETGFAYGHHAVEPATVLHVTLPQQSVPSFFTPQNLTSLNYTQLWTYRLSGSAMPAFAHAMKVSDASGTRRRTLVWPIALALLVGVMVSCTCMLYFGYSKGGDNQQYWYFGRRPGIPGRVNDAYTKDLVPLTDVVDGVKTSRSVYPQNIVAQNVPHSVEEGRDRKRISRYWQVFIGAGVMTLLMVLHKLFLWWPLHPLGFAFAATIWVRYLWMMILAAWIVKWAVLRYGGVKLYRAMRPLFLGFILGDFFICGIWFLVDIFIGQGKEMLR